MHKALAATGLGLALLAAPAARAAGPEPVLPLRGYWQPGGYEARVGSPYYYSVPGFPEAAVRARDARSGDGTDCNCRNGVDAPPAGPAGPVPALAGPVPAPAGPTPAADGVPVEPPVTVYNFPYQRLPGDPYTYHFGPGFYRRAEYGHYRFPYYTYRAPWYFPGHPVYNRDTNFPW